MRTSGKNGPAKHSSNSAPSGKTGTAPVSPAHLPATPENDPPSSANARPHGATTPNIAARGIGDPTLVGRRNLHQPGRQPGWHRSIFVRPFRFDDTGFPDFGAPVTPGSKLPLPSGEYRPAPALPFSASLSEGRALPEFSYYGHQQFLDLRNDGVHLGMIPRHPVNDFRCGEKLVINDANSSDFETRVTVHILAGDRDAGLLFRVTNPSVGHDAHKGYSAALHAGAGAVMLHTEDDTFPRGSVGLRVVDTHARFSKLSIKERK